MSDGVKQALFVTLMAAVCWLAYLSFPVVPSDWAVLSLALAFIGTAAAISAWLSVVRPRKR